ncbi:MAG: DUF1846 domain-containing protein [Candidatus Firestonebacteria bacterium]
MKKIGFDNKKYLIAQTRRIMERVGMFKGKLYLEFGGKICYDYHASRVLPGYDPNVKISLLKELGDNIEIVYCVSAKDIQDGKVRGDFGLTYDNVTLKTMEDLQNFGLEISCVVITRFSGEKKALVFKKHLESLGMKTYISPEIDGYPNDIDRVVSDEGFGKVPHIETKKPVVIVTGSGPGSGKMAMCLSQVFHDSLQAKHSGFAKFETFPIWNLPLKHPVNVAYEAATADLGDINMVDPFHLNAYGVTAINYNRDIENFGIMKRIIDKIADKENHIAKYNSPTDMGVSMGKEGIINDDVICEAAKQEIIRRWFRYNKEFTIGVGTKETVVRTEKIIQEIGIKLSDRNVVEPARNTAHMAREQREGHKGIFCGAAIELLDGTILTAHNSSLFHAESAVIIKAIKKLSGVPDNMHLLTPLILTSIGSLKTEVSGVDSPSLNVDETLIVLSVSSSTNPLAETGIKNLKYLANCEMHLTHLPTAGDEAGLRKLKVNYTTDSFLTLQNYIGI